MFLNTWRYLVSKVQHRQGQLTSWSQACLAPTWCCCCYSRKGPSTHRAATREPLRPRTAGYDRSFRPEAPEERWPDVAEATTTGKEQRQPDTFRASVALQGARLAVRAAALAASLPPLPPCEPDTEAAALASSLPSLLPPSEPGAEAEAEPPAAKDLP